MTMNHIKEQICFSILVVLFFLPPSAYDTLYGQDLDQSVLNKLEQLREKYQEEFGAREKNKINQADAASFRNGVGEDVKVTSFTEFGIEEAEPSIAINPTNPDNVVISFIHRDRGAPIEGLGSGASTYYSFDAGQTWSRSYFNQDSIFYLDHEEDPDFLPRGGADPVYAFDKNGRLYCVWLYGLFNPSEEGFFIATYWGWSDDGGRSFQVAPAKEDRLLGSGSIGNSGFMGTTIDRPWLAVDNSDGPYSGTVYIQGDVISSGNSAFGQFFNGSGVIYKAPNSTSFATHNVVLNEVLQDFDDSREQIQFAHLHVDGQGVLHLSFSALEIGVPKRVYHLISTDGSESFSNLSAVSTIAYSGSQSSAARENPMPDAITNPITGSTHLVYGAKNANGLYGQYQTSTDNGANWTEAQDLATMIDARSTELLFPTIAVDELSGRISIAYMGRDSSNAWNYYLSSSNDDGQSWEKPCKLSSVSTDYEYYFNNPVFFGDYWETKMAGDKSYCVWNDGRGQNGSKIHVAVVDHQMPVSTSEVSSVTDQFKVLGLSPNPASDILNIGLEIQASNHLLIDLLSIDGRTRNTLFDNSIVAGEQNIQVNLPQDIETGLYILHLYTDLGFFTRKLVIRR